MQAGFSATNSTSVFETASLSKWTDRKEVTKAAHVSDTSDPRLTARDNISTAPVQISPPDRRVQRKSFSLTESKVSRLGRFRRNILNSCTRPLPSPCQVAESA